MIQSASLSLAFDILARDSASKTFKNVGDSADRAGGKIGGLGTKFAGLGKAVALGIGALGVGSIALGKTFVDAAVESQKVTAQTAAVIKSMGGVAGVSAKKVADLSESLAMKTGIDDELIQSGQNLLLTFGKIRNEVGKGNDIFDQATKAALDMSVALGTDMTSASTTIGKALNDPIAGLTSLTRVGVQFTDQQREQIKAMVDVGDVAGAQKVILGELSAQFAGSAEAQATAQGKLSVAWGNIQETLGEKLLPLVERFATVLADNLPAAMARAEEYGRRLGDWARNHETEVKALAFAVGTVLVGAMVAYAVSATAAAAATIAATWPILAVVAAGAALAAGLIYLRSKWNDTTSVVFQFNYALDRVVGAAQSVVEAIKDIIHYAKLAIDWLGKIKVPNVPRLPDVTPGFDVPFVPYLDDGGVMPGPRGVHSLAMVAGGETILPTHKPGFKLDGGGFDAVGEDQLAALREQNGLLRGILGAVTSSGPDNARLRAAAAVMG